MTAVASPPRAPSRLPVGSANGGRPSDGRRVARDPLAVRLAVFAALATFGAVHWAGLVADPPVDRLLVAVAIACAGCVALALVGRADVGGAARALLSAVTAVATTATALIAAGLPARFLVPRNFAELADNLDRGLSGIRSAGWPYAGEDEWLRLVVLLGAPLLLALAASLAFWPARRAAPVLRALGLVVLVLLYAVAVTERHPGAPLLHGLLLLLLVAAWMWLPRLTPREAGVGAALVVAVGICALPFARALDADRPWWDYRAWSWFGGGRDVTFDWNHSYGPLGWPREGTTLLNIRSDRPHYWKAETLDRFDGFRWLRSQDSNHSRPAGELPDHVTRRGRPWRYGELNPAWDERVRVTVRSLRSEFVVGAGNSYDVDGLGASAGSADGTFVKLDEPLEKGDTYTVHFYAPDASGRQLRGAPPDYEASLSQYTRIFLPRSGETALGERGVEGDAALSARGRQPNVVVDLRGDPISGTDDAERRLATSPYARMYRLARRLTAGSPTAYDAVKRVEDHLQRNYTYNERVPRRDFPLAAFLFEDREGYCQQFSGAMALMLRMLGIPSRVVSGFSPGSYNRETREYRVRDLDAHSWVEVYFGGIGWVPFDPTPTVAPAESQSSGFDATSAARADAGEVRGGGAGGSGSERSRDPGGGSGSRGPELGLWALPVGLSLLALGAAAWWALRDRGRTRVTPAAAADAQLRELELALFRLGWRLPPGTTLLTLERQLARAAGPAAARYAAKLRAHRYDARSPHAPGREERRAVRRELTSSGGLRARLRGFLALPPGAPRVR